VSGLLLQPTGWPVLEVCEDDLCLMDGDDDDDHVHAQVSVPLI
jgi:hypothetical protein